MARSSVATCALSHHLNAWPSLVSRSIAVYNQLSTLGGYIRLADPGDYLKENRSLDDSLENGGTLTFWFFQRREVFISQKRMKQWSRDNLDDYVLLPATPGYVTRLECFFVSHFWRTQNLPDPDGEYLCLHQAELEPQAWSYIWVDWSCMPQNPRTPPEAIYFQHCLRTMSAIIRNCGFIYFYPPFEPRLWILYEITEYTLTCSGGILKTPDIETYLQYIDEMLENGVQDTLAKHAYQCPYEPDRQYLLSWLEVLVLLRRSKFGVNVIRRIMDNMTWFKVCRTQFIEGVGLNRFEGTLKVNGSKHKFTPFPPEVGARTFYTTVRLLIETTRKLLAVELLALTHLVRMIISIVDTGAPARRLEAHEVQFH